MKKIIQKEIIEYSCDVCGIKPEWGIASITEFNFGYDSGRDGDHGDFHFCNKCAEEFWQNFQKLYPNLKLIEEDRKW